MVYYFVGNGKGKPPKKWAKPREKEDLMRSFKTLCLVILAAMLGFSGIAKAGEPQRRWGYLTAYTSTKGETDSSPFIAAGNRPVHEGMVANNCFRPGTKLKFFDPDGKPLFEGKEFITSDVMNFRMTCGKFDVWLPVSHKEALKFGRKLVIVEYYYPAGSQPAKK